MSNIYEKDSEQQQNIILQYFFNFKFAESLDISSVHISKIENLRVWIEDFKSGNKWKNNHFENHSHFTWSI